MNENTINKIRSIIFFSKRKLAPKYIILWVYEAPVCCVISIVGNEIWEKNVLRENVSDKLNRFSDCHDILVCLIDIVYDEMTYIWGQFHSELTNFYRNCEMELDKIRDGLRNGDDLNGEKKLCMMMMNADTFENADRLWRKNLSS